MPTYFTEFGDCLEDPLGGGGIVELGHVLLPDQRVLDGHPRPRAGPRPCLSEMLTLQIQYGMILTVSTHFIK